MKKELYQFVQKCIIEHPNKREEIKDIYYLALSEIEEGGSEEHECYLAEADINQIISGL